MAIHHLFSMLVCIGLGVMLLGLPGLHARPSLRQNPKQIIKACDSEEINFRDGLKPEHVTMAYHGSDFNEISKGTSLANSERLALVTEKKSAKDLERQNWEDKLDGLPIDVYLQKDGRYAVRILSKDNPQDTISDADIHKILEPLFSDFWNLCEPEINKLPHGADEKQKALKWLWEICVSPKPGHGNVPAFGLLPGGTTKRNCQVYHEQRDIIQLVHGHKEESKKEWATGYMERYIGHFQSSARASL